MDGQLGDSLEDGAVVAAGSRHWRCSWFTVGMEHSGGYCCVCCYILLCVTESGP